MHSKNRHKFTVISHREQETFNVAVMKYKNSSVYIQRQIDRILKSFDFARVYVNNIVVFFKSLNEHIKYLQLIFQNLRTNNISKNFKKAFLNYSCVTIFEQRVTSLKLSTNEFKLQTIASLEFSTTLNPLKIILNLID